MSRHLLIPDAQIRPGVPTGLQACTKCGEVRGPEGFNLRKARGQPYRQCRDCMSARKWAQSNPERHKAARMAWVDSNRDKVRAIWREAARRKYARDPAKRIHGRISNQIWSVIKRAKGCRSAFELLGYSFDELRTHLERQFQPGMSWGNMGEWHVDHIMPLSSFTITGPDDPELRRAWALTNLRPLWAVDNMRKGARIEVLV